MLTIEELKTLRDALPYNSTKLIISKCTRVSTSMVSRALNKPEHYRKDIIDAALEVVQEHRDSIETQRSQISALS